MAFIQHLHSAIHVLAEEHPRDREALLASRALAGDRRAAGELVESCLPAIDALARHYRGSSTIHREELVQAGVVGLLLALKRYDPARGTPFWAYASWWVRQAMQQLVAELAYPVVLSDRALRHLARLHRAQGAHGLDASAGDLARACELTTGHVQRLLAVDRIPDAMQRADGVEDDALDRVETRLAGAQLRGLPGGLVRREREVLRAHFGLDGPSRTLEQIADAYGVSGERVRQIEARALDKVRLAALGAPAALATPQRGTSPATPVRSGAPARR